MGQSHTPFEVVDNDGLYVALMVGAGGGIAHMAYGDISLAQRFQPLGRKYFTDQSHVAAGGEHPPVVDHDAGALLSPVLQSKQAVISQAGHILLLGAAHPKYTALLVQVPLLSPHSLFLLHAVSFLTVR